MMPPGTTKSQTFSKASWEGNQLEDIISPLKAGAIQPISTQKHVVEDEAPRPSDTNPHQYAQKPTSKLTSQ